MNTTTNTFEGWAIDRDYLAQPDDGTRVGTGQMAPEVDSTTATWGRRITIRDDLKASRVQDPVRFRLLDDDGEVYYGGAISRSWIDGEEERAFAPLAFGTADAGCTDLEYHYGDGAWKVL